MSAALVMLVTVPELLLKGKSLTLPKLTSLHESENNILDPVVIAVPDKS
mgnify:CR=1 FL=1